MTRPFTRFFAALLLVALTAACAHRQDLRKPATQDDFGVQMAKMNLWREAMFRFHRAIEINPNDARAHNNLAVAYEANGEFEKARKEYLEALKLDRSNQYIQKNYSRFVEFLSRNRKRDQEASKATSAAPSAAPAAVPASTAPATAPVAQPAVTEPIKPGQAAPAPATGTAAQPAPQPQPAQPQPPAQPAPTPQPPPTPQPSPAPPPAQTQPAPQPPAQPQPAPQPPPGGGR